ncbi:MAG: dihydropteroate synthase [Deltaproteobacteria bacterium]
MGLICRLLKLTSAEASVLEMRRIGVDPAGIAIMGPKQAHYNLRLEGLTPAQANVLKQDVLAIGGEAAVAKGAASCAIATSGAVVSGTMKQMEILFDKLSRQSFGLPGVALCMKEALQNALAPVVSVKGRTRSWAVGKKTLIMGILNVTPDSFSDGGLYIDPAKALEKALSMVEDGAHWIDVGGESTRPGAQPIDADEEAGRVLPLVSALASRGIAVSVDTAKASVAQKALEAGAEIINDISGLSDPDMATVCANYKCGLVIMHKRGTPLTMQSDVCYDDLVGEVYGYLQGRLTHALSLGIDLARISVDPGIGFGKSAEGNLELIRRLGEFRSMGRPVLVGPSRKSFIAKTIGLASVAARDAGTLSACSIAVMNGAHILRVHDVAGASAAAALAEGIRG